MAAVDAKGRPVKFIRVRGRVVPVPADKYEPKSPQAKQQMRDRRQAVHEKNYSKYGDGASQASRIENHYENRKNKIANKGFAKGAAFGAVAGLGAMFGRGSLNLGGAKKLLSGAKSFKDVGIKLTAAGISGFASSGAIRRIGVSALVGGAAGAVLSRFSSKHKRLDAKKEKDLKSLSDPYKARKALRKTSV